MLHEQLTALKNVEFAPFVLPLLAIGGVALAIFMLFKRDDRWAALMFLGVGGIAGSLAWGVLMLEQPLVSQFKWPKGMVKQARELIGPDELRGREQFVLLGFVLSAAVTYIGFDRQGQPGFGEAQMKKVGAQSALGASELCDSKTFKRNWGKVDKTGLTFKGKFWGRNGRLLGTAFHLGGEDIARGVATVGGQGSGKTQAVILPTIAERMNSGHSLVVTDVQGELLPYILAVAGKTGHTVIVHNPSNAAESAPFNVADAVQTVTDAKGVATILLSAENPDDFWASSGVNLLAACLLHYPSVGAVMQATGAPARMGRELQGDKTPGVSSLANAFITSILSDQPKLAHNILATMANQAISAWADPDVCRVTSASAFRITQLAQEPTVLVLRCARRHQEALGKYLGAILSVIVTELDAYGESSPNGILPIPVGLILEEFPALGRLDGLVNAINVIRKRRISVLVAAQTMGQFYGLYGKEGAETLLAGLATKVIFGGCDLVSAEFFSKLSGQTTVTTAGLAESADGTGKGSVSASVRGRALLMPDDIIRPAISAAGAGTGTIFAASAGQQQIFHAQLRMYFQGDWPKKLKKVPPATPLRPDGPILDDGLALLVEDAPQVKPPPLPTDVVVIDETGAEAEMERERALPAVLRYKAKKE